MGKYKTCAFFFGLLAGLFVAAASPRAADPAQQAQVIQPVTPTEEAAPPGEGAEPAETPERQPKTDYFDSGKLLATSGVSQLEGAGGGGLVPWALITGYGTRDAVGGNVHYTNAHLSNFNIQSEGAAIGLFDRVEFSYTYLDFDTRTTGGKLGFGNGFAIAETIVGAKVKLFGDAIYDQDSWIPQVSAGLQYKANNRSQQMHAVGAKSNDGVDYYLAATKLFLGESLLVDATLRETKANQMGILGFGGDRDNSYMLEYEGSVAYLLTNRIAIGAEARTKPSNLSAAKESNAYDVFGAYFITKNASVTLAYLQMGDIATESTQRGPYLSLQVGF